MTLRVPRDRPLPLAGRHTFPAGAVTPDGPGCLLAALVFAGPWAHAPSVAERAWHELPSRLKCAPPLGYDSTAPGGVPEWLKGADCKSVGAAYPGSNPGSPTRPG